jgi:hypothetical protein
VRATGQEVNSQESNGACLWLMDTNLGRVTLKKSLKSREMEACTRGKVRERSRYLS